MGPHRYQLRINQKVICEFEHNREDDLSMCLTKASDAAFKAKWARAAKLYEELTSEHLPATSEHCAGSSEHLDGEGG